MAKDVIKKVLFSTLFLLFLSINTWAGKIHLHFADGSKIWMTESLLSSDLNVKRDGLLGRLLAMEPSQSEEKKEADEKTIQLASNGSLFITYVADILNRGQGVYFPDSATAKNVLELCKELGLPKAQKYVEDYVKKEKLPQVAAQLLQAFLLDDEKELKSIVLLNELDIHSFLIPLERRFKEKDFLKGLKLHSALAIDGTKGVSLLGMALWGKKVKWIKQLIEMGADLDTYTVDYGYGPESGLNGRFDVEQHAKMYRNSQEILQMIIEAKKSKIGVPIKKPVMTPHELEKLKLEIKNQTQVCADLSLKENAELIKIADLNRELERLLSLKSNCEASLLNAEQTLSDLQQKCLASQQELLKKEQLMRRAGSSLSSLH